MKKTKKNKTLKLPPNLRGKYVSRAAFAKMQGEKNRLEKDVYTLVMSKDFSKLAFIKNEYRKKFEKGRLLSEALREILQAKFGTFPKLDKAKGAFK